MLLLYVCRRILTAVSEKVHKKIDGPCMWQLDFSALAYHVRLLACLISIMAVCTYDAGEERHLLPSLYELDAEEWKGGGLPAFEGHSKAGRG